MEYKISELMELIEEDTVRFERRNDVSPQKIKETVMNKIHSDNKTSRPSRRWGCTLLIAAIIVCLALAGAVAAGADPLSIFGQATEKQRQDAEYRQEQYEATIAEGREYHEPYLVDELDLDAIPTENDVVQVIEEFTRTPIYIDAGGGEPYEGPELEGCRVHLKESYYDGTNLRLGIALETLDGEILYPVEGLDATFSSVEEDGVPKQQYYFTDHIRLTDGEHWVYAEPVYSDLAPSGMSYADITQEYTLYDEETGTATMRCNISLSQLGESGRKELTVRLFPDDTVIGRFTVEVPELETRLCLFEAPLEFSPEGYDGTGRVLGIELSATGVYFLVEMGDFSLMDRDENTAWAKASDVVTRGTLHMDDGSDFSAPGCDSVQKYENGIAYFYCSWRDTIDINAVTAITIGDTTLELN